MKIKKYKLVKQEDGEVEVFIPNEPYYGFETHIRRSIRIVPRKSTIKYLDVNIGDVIGLSVTCVYLSSECIVDKFYLSIDSISTTINDYANKPGPHENFVYNVLVDRWADNRTKEQFEKDLDFAIKQFKDDSLVD